MGTTGNTTPVHAHFRHVTSPPYAGDRGFRRATTRRLVASLARYKSLRDEPKSGAALVAYCRAIIAELHRELRARGSRRVRAA